MLNEKDLMRIATRKLIDIFGKQYLRDNYTNIIKSYGMIDNNIFGLFVGIKSDDDLPGRKAERHGWVVYGQVNVNATTGKVINSAYALE